MSAAARRSAAVAPWPGAARVGSRADVDRLIAEVAGASRQRDRTSDMRSVVERAGAGQPDTAGTIPVAAELAPLFPWPGGLRRGSAVAAVGSTSLLFAMLAGGLQQGGYAAVVGMPQLCALPAEEYGLDLSRLAFVPHPGEQWASVVAALIDGVDLVVVATPSEVPAATARSVMARARQRGCVLIPTRPWPGCDLTVRLVDRQWYGLGQGRGRLRGQQVLLESVGRGRAAQPRRVSTTMPPPSLAEHAGRPPGEIPGWQFPVPAPPWEAPATSARTAAPSPSRPAGAQVSA